MAHAFLWTELNSSNNTEVSREISSAGFGTNTSTTWTKKLFKLKWINSDVENIRLWIDNEYANIYNTSHYPTIKNTSNLKIIEDLGFEFKFTVFDTFIVNQTNADLATSSNLGSTTIVSGNFLIAPSYIDGIALDTNKKILVKSQSDTKTNGLYKVSSTSGQGTYGGIVAEDILTAAKIVTLDNASYFLYSVGLSPFQSAAAGSTSFKWVNRSALYQLANVDCATESNLQQSAVGLSTPSLVLDNHTLSTNDRVLVKDQSAKSENGIYFVSSLYQPNANTYYNPYNSSLAADDFWDSALDFIRSNNSLSVQFVNSAVGNSGGYFRYYSGSGLTGGTASTSDLKWANAAYNYKHFGVNWYYEISSGSAIGFSFDLSSNSGTLTSTPRQIVNSSGIATTLATNERVLVKHYLPSFSGIYTVSNVGSGSTGLWVRNTEFDSSSEITQTVVSVANNTNSLGGNIWYLGKTETYNSLFLLNIDPLTIQERYYPYTYEPVNNLVNANQTDLTSVNEVYFSNSGIAISQRVLVSGQTSFPAQNGIYSVSSICDVVYGLKLNDNFSVLRGSVARIVNGNTGAGTTYMLYAPGTNTSPGAIGVTWVDITNITNITCNAETTVNKFSSQYITPNDFDVAVAVGTTVLVRIDDETRNGIYTVSAIGNSQKQIFNYENALSSWTFDIFESVLSEGPAGSHNVSPNFKKQIKGIYQIASIASTETGQIFVPEISFPSFQNYENFFGSEGKGSSLLQDLDIDWYKQDFQKYSVKAVLNVADVSLIPTTSGTAISSLVHSHSGLGNTILQSNDSVLIFVGSGSSSSSALNGIYRPSFTGIGSVYFTQHEDFYFDTKFESTTDKKSLASPYERPSVVSVEQGYMGVGTTFQSKYVYMQGEVAIRTNTFSSDYSTEDLEKYLHTGTETFKIGSEIRLNTNSQDLDKFPRLAPIQHTLLADLALDTVSNDILIVKRNGNQLYSLVSGDPSLFYFQINDRVFYYATDEDIYNSSIRKSTSGIYQIIYIDTNFNYYLRKVKNNSVNGHLDYSKRLVAQSSIGGTIFYLARPETSSTVFTWTNSNYPVSLSDVYLVSTGNTVIPKTYSTDYTINPSDGQISVVGTGWTGTLYVHLYADNTVPSYDAEPKQILNRYYYIPRVTKDRFIFTSGVALGSSTWQIDSEHFQVVNSIGTATTTEIKFNRDRSSWLADYDTSKNYSSVAQHILSSDSVSNYFFTDRLSSDGYYFKTGLGNSSVFNDTNLIDPITLNKIGLFTGDFYLEKLINSGIGATLTDWYAGLGLTVDANVLILTNKTTPDYSDKIIDSSYQSSYYDDLNRLILQDKTGKRDQKVYTFKRNEYQTVSLDYHSAFGVTLSPIQAILTNSAGSGTFVLYYDPANTNRNTSNRSWIDVATRSSFLCATGNTGGVPDFNDITYVPVIGPLSSPSGSGNTAQFDGYVVGTGDTILIRNQSDSTKNGIYTSVVRNKYTLVRATDLNATSELYELGRVSFGNRIFELNLPDDNSSYNLGASALNTPLIWKNLGSEYVIDVVGLGHTNFSNLNALPDYINGREISEGNKVFFFGQTTNSEKIVARFRKKVMPNLTRVGNGSSTTQFQISSLYVNDANRNINYELYYDPSLTSVGTHPVEWFRQNFISNFLPVSFGSTIPLSVNNFIILNVQKGDRILLFNQTNETENGIYYYDIVRNFYLSRDEFLDSDDEISVDKKVYVSSGFANTGYYGLSFDEDVVSPGIGITPIYWTKIRENTTLTDARVASIANINLTNPPSKVDEITLRKFDRILLKNQTSQTENGVYIVSSIGNSNVWTRATDLDSSSELIPQLSVNVGYGTTNANKNFRIKLPVPRTITNTQTTAYILNTDNINWIDTSSSELYESSPELWQNLKAGYENAVFLGTAKMGVESTASSRSFGIAVRTPNSTILSGFGITQNGKVRGLNFKVEYKITKD
jgi:hypothetical protein